MERDNKENRKNKENREEMKEHTGPDPMQGAFFVLGHAYAQQYDCI